MSALRVSIDIDATPETVWNALSDVQRHVDWMQDAVAIRFVGEQTTGVGTHFDCDTKVGPFRLTDHMTVTAWKQNETMGVDHHGIVTGTGAFSLFPTDTGTRFVWEEQLTFPWFMGGGLGELFARPIFRHIWRGNLRGLKQQIENR